MPHHYNMSGKKVDPKKKKGLTPAQKKIAAAAPPFTRITGADFKALKGRKKKNGSKKISKKS